MLCDVIQCHARHNSKYMKKINKFEVCIACVLIAVLSAISVIVCKDSGSISHDREASVSTKVDQKSADGRRKRIPNARPKVTRLVNDKPMLNLSDDEDDRRTPEEKKLAADIEKALDKEDVALAKKCADAALKCKDVEIRQAMVDALGWFGEKTIPELTPFIADPDEDVAESAMNEWEMAVSTIEDDEEKIGTVELAMQIVTNEDALESMSGEYIGVDEKLAVESLLRIIESGCSAAGIAKAKETYEFVTGDEFVSRADAEKWIAEEYNPE